MALVLHRDRLDRHALPALLSPYVGKSVLVHLACEDRLFSWKGSGVLRVQPEGWFVQSDEIPFNQVVGYDCVLSVVPEPETSSEAGVDDLIKQARSLADLLNQVRQA